MKKDDGLPPEAGNTRWTSWCESEFFLADNLTQAVTNILELIEDKLVTLKVKLTTFPEGCTKMVTDLTVLEGSHHTNAVFAFNIMEDLGT